MRCNLPERKSERLGFLRAARFSFRDKKFVCLFWLEGKIGKLIEKGEEIKICMTLIACSFAVVKKTKDYNYQ